MVTISAGTPPYLPLEQSAGPQGGSELRRLQLRHHALRGRRRARRRSCGSSVVGRAARTAQIDAFLAWLQSRGAGRRPRCRAIPSCRESSRARWRKIRAQRFTADELVRALKQYLTGDLVFSHRYSLTGRLARWARRTCAATVAVLSLLAFAIGGALVWAQLSRQAKRGGRAARDRRGRAVPTRARRDAPPTKPRRDADGGEGARRASPARGQGCPAAAAEADRKRRAAEETRRAAERRGDAGEGRCRTRRSSGSRRR